MKIVDKDKDFYDYVESIYGIDDEVIFYRATKSKEVDFKRCGFNGFLSMRVLKEKTKTPYKTKDNSFLCTLNNKIQSKIKEIEIHGFSGYCEIIIGNKRHKIIFDKYLENKLPKLNIIYHDIISRDSLKNIPEDPIIIPRESIFIISPDYIQNYELVRNWFGEYEEPNIINPILRGTIFEYFLDPSDIWWDIYGYLGNIKDNIPQDERDNKQKIIDSGFDLKTSFRKC